MGSWVLSWMNICRSLGWLFGLIGCVVFLFYQFAPSSTTDTTRDLERDFGHRETAEPSQENCRAVEASTTQRHRGGHDFSDEVR